MDICDIVLITSKIKGVPLELLSQLLNTFLKCNGTGSIIDTSFYVVVWLFKLIDRGTTGPSIFAKRLAAYVPGHFNYFAPLQQSAYPIQWDREGPSLLLAA